VDAGVTVKKIVVGAAAALFTMLVLTGTAHADGNYWEEGVGTNNYWEE
jgi:hypothetical protein